MYEYRAQVSRIVDADTLDLHVDLGFYMYSRQRFRLDRINAWETRGPERELGKKAKREVARLIPPGSEVRITTTKAGKYGRWLAEVYIDRGDIEYNLNDWLVENDHAEWYGA